MRMLAPTVALAAIALSLTLTAAPASARFAPANQISSGQDTTFDLGVDVSQVPLDAKDVGAYVASLDPETQNVILDSCANYVANPVDAKAGNTVTFCQIAAAGVPAPASDIHAFASASPAFVAALPAPAASPDAANVMTNGQSGIRYRVFPSDSSKGSF